jgi:RNA polymerase sigma-70 factor, ECF subfamily
MPVPTPPESVAAPSSSSSGAIERTVPSGVEKVRSITELLHAWSAGDARASDDLARLVYAELRRQARRALRREGEGHTLQPTALVHEAWLRLDSQHDAGWESRTQFFAVAAQTMRRVLVDHARTRHALKRGGARVQITLSDVDRERAASDDSGTREAAVHAIDLLALDEALRRLAALDPRKARLVELRYFAGLSIPEAADALGVSAATVGREWAVARAWLRRELEA